MKIISLLTCFLILCSGDELLADGHNDRNTEIQSHQSLPQDVESSLDYLYRLLDFPEAAFNPDKIRSLLAYSAQKDLRTARITPRRRNDSIGNLHAFSMNASIEKILHYFYNPDIPKYVVLPSLLRLDRWHPETESALRKKPLWEKLDTLDAPLVFRGSKYEVNTPNSDVGGYYRYDLNRLIILMKDPLQTTLVSVTKILKPSDFGKKGVIIDDHNWDYFYSDIDGVSHSLISWANTQIYHSASIIVYTQPASPKPQTRVMMFNWLKAGWNGINVVKSSKIAEGCQRFADNATLVLESPSLPPAANLARDIQHIQSLPSGTLDKLVQEYATAFEQKARKHPKMTDKNFSQIIANGSYTNGFTREEKIGILLQELFKSRIGKQALISLPMLDGESRFSQNLNLVRDPQDSNQVN